MKQISYEEAIRKNHVCIITGEEIHNLKPKMKESFRIGCIRDGVPMKFTKINTVIRRSIQDDLLYIKFWQDIKIYRMEE